MSIDCAKTPARIPSAKPRRKAALALSVLLQKNSDHKFEVTRCLQFIKMANNQGNDMPVVILTSMLD